MKVRPVVVSKANHRTLRQSLPVLQHDDDMVGRYVLPCLPAVIYCNMRCPVDDLHDRGRVALVSFEFLVVVQVEDRLQVLHGYC